ncbi:hypothetical protein SEMRO_1942_G306770.1 [Seminavis robusta]|uniref:Uncharacterized protein n=1 Tax=Seminavis robusta TaxID=568900 RepID=A0A9N8EUT0_9STRA|nr:hypothetical protein SEMRO_1942_G306770.1 [Seminavis robusta]|eukprot:Sro1942_g306770.1 n/a (179) ;mRNA; r:10442-10978
MRPEFAEYGKNRFGPNLRNLQSAIARDYNRMAKDCAYFGNDMSVLLEQRKENPPVERSWHTSEAKTLLEEDITNGIHLSIDQETGKKIEPKAIYRLRPEYREFTLKVFRNHIYQEVKRREKIESKHRFGKKKLRNPAAVAHPHLVALAQLGEEKTKESVAKKIALRIQNKKKGRGKQA